MIKFDRTFWKDAAGYVFMPRVVPLIKTLYPDTSFFAQLLLQIFINVGLLPQSEGRSWLIQNPQLSIRDVMGRAAGHLRRDWRHIDQYLVYGAFGLGMLLLLIQFILILVMLLSQTADAAAPFVSMFVTSDPYTDIAFMMLDSVFQVPDFFNSRFDPAIVGSISSQGYALHELFAFYTRGISIIAVFILFYHVFSFAVETARTGVPFGKRFPHVYGPIRIVLAVLLLLPLSYGLNTGQYLTLYMAKWGSSLATNSWIEFNVTMQQAQITNPIGLISGQLIGEPKVQSAANLINFFYLVHTCRAAYDIAYGGKSIEPYFVVPGDATRQAVAIKMTASSSFPDTLNTVFRGGDITITFGQKSAGFTEYNGNVKPYCGMLTIAINSKDVTRVSDIYNAYFNYIVDLWQNPDMIKYGRNMAYILRFLDYAGSGSLQATSVDWDAPLSSSSSSPAGSGFYSDMRINLQASFNGDLQIAISLMRNNPLAGMIMDSTITDLGWAGAGIWYNHIAEMNGAMVDAVFMVPTPSAYPLVMEHVAAIKRKLQPNIPPKSRFSPVIGGRAVSLEQFQSGSRLDSLEVDIEIAKLLDTVYQTVADDTVTERPAPQVSPDDPIRKLFLYIYTESGLMDVRANDGVNPLAKLTVLGKTILNKTIVSLGVGTLLTGFGGILAGSGMAEFGAAFQQFGGVLLSFATTGLVIGLLLYYLLPLYPFIYFFFAAGAWVKSIFEAMVAMPLWALSHLRWEGEGVGNAASKGYFMLMDIMLRPIFTLLGLLAAVASFSALASGLDLVFDLVVMNVNGFDMTTFTSTTPGENEILQSMRDMADVFFYTIMYIIIIYMMATACFKLINVIPNKMMRFLQPVPSFQDFGGDPAENLSRNMAYAGAEVTGKTIQGLEVMVKGAGESVGKVIEKGRKSDEGAK